MSRKSKILLSCIGIILSLAAIIIFLKQEPQNLRVFISLISLGGYLFTIPLASLLFEKTDKITYNNSITERNPQKVQQLFKFIAIFMALIMIITNVTLWIVM